MEHKYSHIFPPALLSAFFLCADQLIKLFFRTHQEMLVWIVQPWLKWEYFENTGIAFGLPVPALLVLFVTPLILCALVLWFIKKQERSTLFIYSVFFIFAGALSNFFDRSIFQHTIDYVHIFTSVINLADIMIVGGAVGLVVDETQSKSGAGRT
jgi:lipoprotein signal peptidase